MKHFLAKFAPVDGIFRMQKDAVARKLHRLSGHDIDRHAETFSLDRKASKTSENRENGRRGRRARGDLQPAPRRLV
ncbi:MAG TPA: hypothetical protein VFG49_09420 [Dyella sp.]|uniref:hypothetical protein n=1 Tax=Dyella sp. TaxID=1869338 RepID=UPI002D79AA11|nr:hypothetical protein [Dyella sp.]HET6553743.1 hypothetical protein [Dyella sp.]